MALTGHEHRFPLLVPENLLDKENKLVSRLKAAREAGVDPLELRMEEEDSGFKKSKAWATHGARMSWNRPCFSDPHLRRLCIPCSRFGSEVILIFPLKTFQIVNTFRYETKQNQVIHQSERDPLF